MPLTPNRGEEGALYLLLASTVEEKRKREEERFRFLIIHGGFPQQCPGPGEKRGERCFLVLMALWFGGKEEKGGPPGDVTPCDVGSARAPTKKGEKGKIGLRNTSFPISARRRAFEGGRKKKLAAR